MQYRPRCVWRRRLARQASKHIIRRYLAAVLVLECVVVTAQILGFSMSGFSLVRTEESGGVEWFVPGTEDQTGIQEVFGIQFRLEDGEIQFYRSRREIKSH